MRVSSNGLCGVQALRAAQARLGVGPLQPCVFSCELVQQWLESGDWEPARLAAERESLRVKRSTEPYFMYVEAGRADLLPDQIDKEAVTEVLTMPTASFFDACSQQQQQQQQQQECGDATTSSSSGRYSYQYFTGRVAESFPRLMPDANEWTRFVVDRFDDVWSQPVSGGGATGGATGGAGGATHRHHQRGPPPSPSELGYLSVWLGGVGSTTQAHYDVANNCFAQLHGAKRFRVWPPSAHLPLRVYPDAHPRARKSRLDVDAAALSGALPAPAVDAVLRPGEAIFVPAFWFHHVQAVAIEGSEKAQELPPRWQDRRGESGGSSRSRSSNRSDKDDAAKVVLRGQHQEKWKDWASVSVSLNVFSHSRVTLAASSVLNRRPPSLVARGSDGGHEAFAFLARALVEELGADPDLPVKLFRSRYEPIASGKGCGGSGGEEGEGGGGEGGGRPSTIEAASGAGTPTREGECAAWERGGALAVQDQNQLRAWAADTARALSGEDSALVRELLLHHAGAGGEDERSHREKHAAGEMGGGAGGEPGGAGGVGGDVDLLAREAASGVIEITTAHLLELVALRNFGRGGVANALQYAAFRR